MVIDILINVDTKGGGEMFSKKQVITVCDSSCRATQLRESALWQRATQGPRI
jgi:hypothetical protein